MSGPTYLTDLRNHTDRILGALDPQHGRIAGDPINWANLHCASAEKVSNDDGEVYLQVHIEEASPDCVGLCRVVSLLLADVGYKDVRVVTEKDGG